MTAFFPITDFQFVFCGFATFAATVGYACAKRRASASQDAVPAIEDIPASEASESLGYSTSDEKASSNRELQSRKRKSVDDHESSTHRSRKRSRSPSVNVNRSSDTAIIAEVPDVSCSISSDKAETPKIDENTTLTQETSMPAVTNLTDGSIQLVKDVSGTAPVTPPPSPSPPKRAAGFAAFAGAGSPFAASSSSANGATATPFSRNPVWCGNTNESSDRLLSVFSAPQAVDTAAAFDFGSDTDTLLAENKTQPKVSDTPPLAAMERRVKATVTQFTGEEDESIKSELKGVKLFIKRGTKGFTGGMPGHIKLLSHLGCAEERLLFRREPLWKVSMNVRVRPTVRCTFDEEDGVLRIVLKEAIEYGDGAPETRQQELVIYALKRGRVPKKDFKEFAKALLENPLLNPIELTIVEP